MPAGMLDVYIVPCQISMISMIFMLLNIYDFYAEKVREDFQNSFVDICVIYNSITHLYVLL